MTETEFFYITSGDLYNFSKEENKSNLIESHFILEKRKKAATQQSLNSWKNRSGGSDVWANQASNTNTNMFHFTSVFSGPKGFLYYTLSNGDVTGLFKYDLNNKNERRLFHKNDFYQYGMHFSKKRNELVCANAQGHEQVHLELLDEEGRKLKLLTHGDSIDSNPYYSNNNPDVIYYQTCGVGRDEEGYIMGYSPQGIQKINLESQQVDDILMDEGFDYILPKDDSKGNLFCIRRPYQQTHTPSALDQIKQTLLFPIHFIFSIFTLIKTFTEAFNTQQQHAAEGPHLKNRVPPKQFIDVLGHSINLAKIRKQKKKNEDISLVPTNWELIKIDSNKETHVIKRGVSYFDLDENDNISYTNGFNLNFNNNKVSSQKDNIIESYCLA